MPGTYAVRVRATDANGAYSDATVNITVQDPNTVYAGTKTVCVSPSANYSGCPAGAAQQTGVPITFNGKRVLLHRGESFGAVTVPVDHKAVQVGAFGTGAAPVVPNVDIGSGNTPTSAVFPDDVTVSDLKVSNQIIQWISASRVLIYRNTIPSTSNATEQINIGAAFTWFAGGRSSLSASSFSWPREIFVVENNVTGTTSGPVAYNLFDGGSSKTAILGNVMGSSQMHTFRFGALNKSVVAHNAVKGKSSDGMRHAIKLHGLGLASYNDSFAVSGGAWASTQVVVANNLIGDATDNNQWTVSLSPENDVTAEGLQDVIAENNRFVRGANTTYDLVLAGRRLTYRGNTRVDGAAMGVYQGGHAEALPASWSGPYFATSF